MSDGWVRKELEGASFGAQSQSGPLDECYSTVRVCAKIGGEQDCIFTAPNGYTPLLNSGSKDKTLASPMKLSIYFVEEEKVCSDALQLPKSSCLMPLHVWFPGLPDKDTNSLDYRTCCTPPQTCPNGSQLCKSQCKSNSLRAWLEMI